MVNRSDCIVVGSHLRYDGVRQRPHHVVSRLARRLPLLYVEEPFFGMQERDEFVERDGLTILRPVRLAGEVPAVDARTLAAIRAWAAGRSALAWLYTPSAIAIADALAAPIAYDCMDDLAAFDFAPVGIAEAERALLERASVVFAGGPSLFASRRSYGAKVRLEPSGVEFEHFASASVVRPHSLFDELARPIATYVGVIDERVDLEIVAAVADELPNLVLVGPFVKLAPTRVPRRANLHCTGQLSYAALPSILAGTDVALVPFARNAATASLSPTKTPEYLAAGVPVVATDIADVARDYGDVARVANDAASFVRACREALRPDPERRDRGRERARRISWDAIVERMWQAVEREVFAR